MRGEHIFASYGIEIVTTETTKLDVRIPTYTHEIDNTVVGPLDHSVVYE